MHIVLIDDSYAFDGASPTSRALGGAEKAFAYLAGALAARGHDVVAINQCEQQAEIEGVLWVPFDTPRPPECDVLIAFRKPNLMTEFDNPSMKSVLWTWGHPKLLNEPAHQKLLEKYDPALVFIGHHQRQTWKSWRDFREVVIEPGVATSYIKANATENPSLVAIVTTHPLHDLQSMVRLWVDKIHPQNNQAELHIYSARLFAGNVEDRLKDIFAQVMAAKDAGVRVKSPGADGEMAAAYNAARVHFYPVINGEFYGSTLAESQAAGTPAVVYTGGQETQLIQERIRNGQTGYIAPDDDAFVNLALELLADDTTLYQSLSRDAKTLQASRTWQNAAIEFEALWK